MTAFVASAVFFVVQIDAPAFARGLHGLGVRGLRGRGTVVRFVTCRGLSRQDGDAAGAIRRFVAWRAWVGAA